MYLHVKQKILLFSNRITLFYSFKVRLQTTITLFVVTILYCIKRITIMLVPTQLSVW